MNIIFILKIMKSLRKTLVTYLFLYFYTVKYICYAWLSYCSTFLWSTSVCNFMMDRSQFGNFIFTETFVILLVVKSSTKKENARVQRVWKTEAQLVFILMAFCSKRFHFFKGDGRRFVARWCKWKISFLQRNCPIILQRRPIYFFISTLYIIFIRYIRMLLTQSYDYNIKLTTYSDCTTLFLN